MPEAGKNAAIHTVRIHKEAAFIVHGEMDSAQALQYAIQERFSWNTVIPNWGDQWPLLE